MLLDEIKFKLIVNINLTFCLRMVKVNLYLTSELMEKSFFLNMLMKYDDDLTRFMICLWYMYLPYTCLNSWGLPSIMLRLTLATLSVTSLALITLSSSCFLVCQSGEILLPNCNFILVLIAFFFVSKEKFVKLNLKSCEDTIVYYRFILLISSI